MKPALAARLRCAAFSSVLSSLFMLHGCAVPERAQPADPVQREARERRLAALDDYRVQGGFGYWDDAQNLTADIDWRQSPERLSISLRAPLGLGRLDIEQDVTGARVTRSGSAMRNGADAGVLLQEALGLDRPVPLAPLGDWIVGRAGEQATAVTRDEQGRLASLVWRDATGSRWRATVRRYREVDGLALPALLTAENGGRHVRLALADWTIGVGGSDTGAPAAPGRDAPARLRLPGH